MWIQCYRQKCTVSLHVFGKNATFYSAYSPKTHKFASSLNPLHTAESARFYSAFSPTTISLTPRFRRKREVWLRFFAENAQNDLKTHSCEDRAKFNSAFSATTLRHALHFRQKWRVIQKLWISGRIWRVFSKKLAVLRFASISDWKLPKKNLKTDYENLMHVYLKRSTEPYIWYHFWLLWLFLENSFNNREVGSWLYVQLGRFKATVSPVYNQLGSVHRPW